MVKRTKDNDGLPDNKWEFGAFLVKHWLKAAVLIVLTGIAISGFSFKCGKNEIEKSPIYKYQKVDVKK